ncbi:MAG: cation:proton antiporter [Longimicrobiales bacterium]
MNPITVPELPLESPVFVVAVAILVFFGAPLLIRRFGIPGIVGVLISGTLLGPHGLHLLDRSETIVLLGTVGLLYLMFVAALEVDIDGFKEEPGQSLVFGLLSFGIPLALGAAVGSTLFEYSLSTSLLFASIFASHTILAYPVVEELGIVKNRAVNASVSATILSDTAALVILAWVAEAPESGSSPAALGRLFGGLALLGLSAWFLVPRVARAFFRNLEAESYFEFLFAMAVLFVWAALAEWIGIEPLVGAFIAGLALNRRVSDPSTLQNRIDFVGNALFIPFFLFSVGMLVDPGAFMSGGRAWIVAGTTIGLMGTSKLAAAWLTGKAYGFDRSEIGTMFSLTIGQAAAALAITLVGFEAGLFDSSVVNGVVIMVAVSAVLSPVLCERVGRDLVRREQERKVSEERPDRILVPVLDGDTNLESLVGFAMLLRDPDDDEAIRVVRVIRKREEGAQSGSGGGSADVAADSDAVSGTDAEADPNRTNAEADADRKVAEAEQDLEQAEEVAAGAEVDVDTQTRVDEDPIEGVLRAVEENRVTLIVTDWRRPSRFDRRLLGAPTDSVVRRTTQSLFAVRLEDPIESLNRLVVVMPRAVLGLLETPNALRSLQRLAAQMDVPQLYLALGGGKERLEILLEKTHPKAGADVVDLPDPGQGSVSWTELPDDESPPDAEDLVVVVLPRPESRTWSERLEALVELPFDLEARNAFLLFLPTEPPRRGRHHLRFG